MALEQLESLTKPGFVEREALRKAGFALLLVYFDQRRNEVEQLYEDCPLTDTERARLMIHRLHPNA